MTTTDEEFEAIRQLVRSVWIRNAQRWAPKAVARLDEHEDVCTSETWIEFAEGDHGTSWSDLDVDTQFRLANRVVSRWMQRDIRGWERTRSGDQPVKPNTDLNLWGLLDQQPALEDRLESVVDYAPLRPEDIAPLLAELGYTAHLTEGNKEKMALWANAPAGISMIAFSKALGASKNKINQAFWETRQTLERIDA